MAKKQQTSAKETALGCVVLLVLGLAAVGSCSALISGGDSSTSDVASNGGTSTDGQEPGVPAASTAPTQAQHGTSTPRQIVVVERIIDGDTIAASAVEPGPIPGTTTDVQLLEINTPEMNSCEGPQAKKRLRGLLGGVGATVQVTRDQDLRNQSGRHLLYVWNNDGTFVNLDLVRDGYAEAVLYEPNDKHWPRISAAEDGAPNPYHPCTVPEPPQDDSDDSAGGDVDADHNDNDHDEGEGEADAGGLGVGPGDLDCSDIAGPGPVAPGDPDRLDGDGDGIGCED